MVFWTVVVFTAAFFVIAMVLPLIVRDQTPFQEETIQFARGQLDVGLTAIVALLAGKRL